MVQHAQIAGRHRYGAWRTYEPLDRVWDAFVDAHPSAHLLQTSVWSGLKQRSGWSGFRLALLDDNGEIAAGASVLLRSVFGLRIAYVPRGPLTDWSNTELTVALVDAIEDACRARGAALVKIEPGLRDSVANRLLLRRYGFSLSSQTVQPQSTIVVDVSGDERAVLAHMKSKWRYNIRLSARKEVTVRTAASRDLAAFNELMTTTGERDGFGIHSSQYYRDAFRLMVPERATFLMAEYDGMPLAAIVVASTGHTAWYLWGASANRERNRMPNHALQWAGMEWARARGVTHYDLWGIPDDLGKLAVGMGTDGVAVPAETLPVDVTNMPNEDLWGVFRFKHGFGGEVVRYVGAWDKSLNDAGSRLYATGLAVRARRHTAPEVVRTLASDALGKRSSSIEDGATAVYSADAWRSVLCGLRDPHVLQSWEWGDIKTQTGWHADRMVLPGSGNDDTGRFAAYQFLWRQGAPNVPFRVAYVPKGPVVDWEDGACVDQVLTAIEAHARTRNCLFVKIDPDVRSDLASGVVLDAKLKRRGWQYSDDQIQFQNTARSDLAGTEDELLGAMKSKWRYNIRLARRRGIRIREADVDDLASFYRMYAETAERDGFLIRPYAYYDTTWRTMLAAQEDEANPAGGALLLAEHEDEPLPVAGVFLMRYADRAWYFYGASTDRRRRDMPNHLLQWEAMIWARRQGCSTYDWWGAPTDLEDPSDPLQGVWTFKQGFGAVYQPQVGAWDYVTNPPLYALYKRAVPRALDLMKMWKRRGGGATD